MGPLIGDRRTSVYRVMCARRAGIRLQTASNRLRAGRRLLRKLDRGRNRMTFREPGPLQPSHGLHHAARFCGPG